nr:sodium:proton antiporter [Candidatus Pandoraea novymonadis]
MPDGGNLNVFWTLPFVGLLLSIAIGPLFAPAVWNHHFGKISVFWTLMFFVPFSLINDINAAWHHVVHALVEEYIPFIVLLTALFTTSGGICLQGNLSGSAKLNVGLLLLGTVLSSMMGTTGAAMLLIRPLIYANNNRKHNVHVFVFFIFLVANAGGLLTPLGDPPLFLGFLQGIDFFWTTIHLWKEMLIACAYLLVIFFIIDVYYWRKPGESHIKGHDFMLDLVSVRLDGKRNFFLLAAVVGLVLMSGFWHSCIVFNLFGTLIQLQNLVRDVGLIVITLISLFITPKTARRGNNFDWEPMKEVARLFAGIFLTIIPVAQILREGEAGALGWMIRLLTDSSGLPNNAMYFWATGLLSSFLDNTPTYLVFFNTIGGDVDALMTVSAVTLKAISAGAVLMGANTYIGNAPNFMIKVIAEQHGIKMPSFFGYMLWSGGVLLPLFAMMTIFFF